MESLESWNVSESRQNELTSLTDKDANIVDSESVEWVTVKNLTNNTGGSRTEASVDSAYEKASDAQVSSMLGRNRVFLLSAKEDANARSMMKSLSKYLALSEGVDEEGLLNNLAYTLSKRRSRFPWSIAVAARTSKALKQLLEDPSLKPYRASERPRLGFVFTGQGAQWYGMGRQLIKVYPIFKDSLRECDQKLRELGASWSLLGMLCQ